VNLPDANINSEGNDAQNLKIHELARELIKKVDNPPNLVMLIGYIGESKSQDRVRLYLNLNFDEYVEVLRKDIRHTKEADKDMIEFGGTCIWVDKTATITHTKLQASEVRAEFLKGTISTSYLRETRRARRGIFAFPMPPPLEEPGGPTPTPNPCRSLPNEPCYTPLVICKTEPADPRCG
jgi:hypothetical protein